MQARPLPSPGGATPPYGLSRPCPHTPHTASTALAWRVRLSSAPPPPYRHCCGPSMSLHAGHRCATMKLRDSNCYHSRRQLSRRGRIATLIVRDVPDRVVDLLDARARAAGTSREAWLREQLVAIAGEADVHMDYAIHFLKRGPSSASGTVVRHEGSTQGSCLVGNYGRIPEDAFQAYGKALTLAERNAPGDREQAIAILMGVFDEVYEVPVTPALAEKSPRMTLGDAMRGDGLIIQAVNWSGGEPVEVLRESDTPFPRTRYRLIIHQAALTSIDLHYDALNELIDDLKARRPDLKEDAWERL